ncbi:MAG: type II toxin-antitoxin system VapB family antitoxin [Treponema sp.]|nr:type II toxin-antitoxin system VapB family antitoxin [Treponema sp.]MDD7612561.1 type II toxin-antitoxin system VapB family antitoxin [Spirochaetales bacterium]MDY5819400.1 type II toxin-antitoxin system VapB family antitoxin [Treponema sp.]MDY5916664.1 type II toxin-antitoxin system VapB family antitoxin [Treponema sp.]
MMYTKVFTSGNSQAVRIPKEFSLSENEMCIQRVGSTIILFPKENPWEAFDRSFSEFSDDFMADGRNQPEMQVREGL